MKGENLDRILDVLREDDEKKRLEAFVSSVSKT
jgi:hypothetical protein